MRVRDWVGISRRRQAQASWAMEIGLVGVLLVGVWIGDPGVIVNAGVGLLVTQLVPLLERDYGVPMDPALTLWITTAVFLHALGTISFQPGTTSFYRSVPWWDHMTHALSSSVVAGAGYATVRALDEHSGEVSPPSRFMFVFILLFVLAFGVLWEVFEFALTLAATWVGSETVLTQYGLEDTLMDLVFDTLGGAVVAVWGTAHLVDLQQYIRDYFERRTA
ncbi:MAG: hypothetical protein ABEJ40_06270 [Haloarculaceae archaeon]